jgi:undecaprenyl-diphosphatase
MDIVLLLKALIMGVVEGLTEFLPISSTGHLILAGELIGFTGQKADVFKVVIQTGAMLAIVWEYRARFTRLATGCLTDRLARRFLLNLIIAFLPAALLGLAFSKAIKAHLFSALPVAAAFIVGGLVILWVERSERTARIDSVDQMGPLDAFKVGCAQAFALIPGTSRSGATIIGGMLFGLSRAAATEFSFFLAVPTLLAAGLWDAWKHRALLSMADVPVWGIGLLASFVAAFLCVRWLLRYVASHDFRAFAWYRIGFGLLILVTAATGLVDWSAG